MIVTAGGICLGIVVAALGRLEGAAAAGLSGGMEGTAGREASQFRRWVASDGCGTWGTAVVVGAVSNLAERVPVGARGQRACLRRMLGAYGGL